MAWVEADRASLRHALGFSAIFLQADPRLENAITAVQATADGGTRPDNSTETQIRGWLADIATVETKLKAQWGYAVALQAGKVRIDAYRSMSLLRSEGRRVVGYIARALATRPRADIFSSAPTNEDGGAFDELYLGTRD